MATVRSRDSSANTSHLSPLHFGSRLPMCCSTPQPTSTQTDASRPAPLCGFPRPCNASYYCMPGLLHKLPSHPQDRRGDKSALLFKKTLVVQALLSRSDLHRRDRYKLQIWNRLASCLPWQRHKAPRCATLNPRKTFFPVPAGHQDMA